ncbi:hypothetical protein HDK77DRAFT_504226 [Phyllosticta capitalensis]
MPALTSILEKRISDLEDELDQVKWARKYAMTDRRVLEDSAISQRHVYQRIRYLPGPPRLLILRIPYYTPKEERIMSSLISILDQRIADLEEKLDQIKSSRKYTMTDGRLLEDKAIASRLRDIRDAALSVTEDLERLVDEKSQITKENARIKGELQDAKEWLQLYREETDKDAVMRMTDEEKLKQQLAAAKKETELSEKENKRLDASIKGIIPELRKIVDAMSKFKDASQSARKAVNKVKDWVEACSKGR